MKVKDDIEFVWNQRKLTSPTINFTLKITLKKVQVQSNFCFEQIVYGNQNHKSATWCDSILHIHTSNFFLSKQKWKKMFKISQFNVKGAYYQATEIFVVCVPTQ